MNINRFLGIIICLFALTVFIPNTCLAANSSLELDGIGTLILPAGIDIKPAQGETASQRLEAQYDLTFLSADDTLHYARLITFQDKQDMGLAAELFNQSIKNPQLLKLLSTQAKERLEKTIAEKGVRLLQWYPATSIKAGNYTALNLAFRCTATDQLPMPLYVTISIFTPDRQLSGLGILCADSDRKYWDPVFRSTVAKLN